MIILTVFPEPPPAVSRALDRAGFAVISTGLKQCLVDSGGVDNLDSAQMEKLFLSLA